ncbi:hypothetical protein BXZ70DRAFT_1006216 [Cristinia sonorae]|uniref:Neutral metalloproteinase n=1 Tax=Cristinia sonorae TaxID=1940300 RepID=A0A8K0UTK9_9AGAR|nr:hypothetical protein BXZ70DRAFT_1006216 [Cristinia sonorae]
MSSTNICSNNDVHHDMMCCSIIPPFILSNIANCPNAPETARSCAREGLAHAHRLRQLRISRLNASQGGGPPGIIPGLVSRNITTSVNQGRPTAGPKRLNRVIYSANNTQILDFTLLRSEGSVPIYDTAANECYDGFGSTFKFYSDVFDRNSIDDAGMTLTGSVHVGNGWQNAQWNGSQMLFGDGDGVYFNRFTASLDVIAHELTHGVTQYTAALIYEVESGALNESMSDVFGIMVKQHHLGQTAAQSDWLIGSELLTSNVNGVALRSMKNPGSAYNDPVLQKDPQVGHYSEVVTYQAPYGDNNDFGGVHISSGVPNRAFYLVATNLGGYSWDRAGRIWWAVLSGGALPANANFHTFAKMTSSTAERMYGGSVKMVVEQAWRDVGVEIGTAPNPPPPRPDPTPVPPPVPPPPNPPRKTVVGALSGWGTTMVNAENASFTVNGYAGYDGSVRFTAVYSAHSNEEFLGKLSAFGDSLTGEWENSDRQAYLRAGWADSYVLHGPFELRRR